jgi:hypothetical protein
MKTILFGCPHCNQHIEASGEYSGKALDCPACGKTFLVPSLGRRFFRTMATIFEIIVLIVILFATFIIAYGKYEVYSYGVKEEKEFQAHMRELNPEKFETPTQTEWRLRDEAEVSIIKGSSNYLGFNRIMEHYIDDSRGTGTNWVGYSTIDFVNKNGGMERTNLIFRFFILDHHCYGSVDESAMYDRQREESDRLAGK